jgi:hypothetical protein
LKKNSSNHEVKNWAKNTSKNHENKKHCSSRYEMIQPKNSYIEAYQEFTWCVNHPNILSLFRRLGRSLTSLLSSLGYEAHTIPSKNEDLKPRGERGIPPTITL